MMRQLSHNFQLFKTQLQLFLSDEQLLTKTIQRYAYGTDASFYRLVPKLIVRIDDQSQLINVINAAAQYQVSLTFRAAGTSLSGQAITSSVLIILSEHWQKIDIINNGKQIKLQVGVIGAKANSALQKYSRKIGPDPASINSCKIGGIAANNASGMCCGVKNNSYHTLSAIKLIFADGSVLDTSSENSRLNYLLEHQAQIQQLHLLSQKITQHPELLSLVEHKYRLKNTTGYGINALIDFNDPIEMISHLMIGSEGTLAFIADITYHTIKIKSFKATGLYLFDKMDIACKLVEKLSNEGVDAIEIIDCRSLISVSCVLNELIEYNQIDHNTAALLIEFSADSVDELTQKLSSIRGHIDYFSQHLLPSCEFTTTTEIIDKLWNIRKGLFPSVGANRETGTTVVIEDIALPITKLADGVAQLHLLFNEYGYDEAIIFGHALAGNLHFVFTQSFDNKKEVERYYKFMLAVTHMVAIDFQGSLKAEHGTGRNMAPFVELEWGSDLYQIMKQIKIIFDPLNILNTGVIINENRNCHIEHLKSLPAAHVVIDKCIECGFCEPVCPSANFTLSPRQRITVWRRIKALESIQSQHKLTTQQQIELTELKADYPYFGIDSCAATGLCGQSCPVDIDTGIFVKSLRSHHLDSKVPQFIASKIADHYSVAVTGAQLGLNSIQVINNVIGDKATSKAFATLNKFSKNIIPKWYPAWPKAAKKYTLSDHTFTEKVIYIPSCVNRLFGADNLAEDQRSLPQVLQSVLTKAHIQMVIPEKINQLCCGMPWDSKGFTKLARQKSNEYIHALMQVSDKAEWPIIMDASPCALTIKKVNKQSVLPLFEASEFIAKFVLDQLKIKKSSACFMLHKSCSSKKMDEAIYLEKIARACSDNIIIPENIYCCGFAGDKGFYLPELNAHALQTLPAQIPTHCKRGICNSRTCEIGLSEHSKVSYQSFLYLLDEVSSDKTVII